MTQAHFLVAKTSKALAGAQYEVLMSDNFLYSQWKAQNPGASAKVLEKRWLDKAWPGYIASARATLAAMLKGPLADVLKDQITDALIKDNIFQEGRRLQWQNRNRELSKALVERAGRRQILRP